MDYNYDDIIHLPHHVSRRHKPMSLEMGAAQFAPFAALTGHDEIIDETARLTDSLVDLDGDATATLDQKLSQLQALLTSNTTPATITITHFVPDSLKAGGQYMTQAATIRRIDDINKQLILADRSAIPIRYIIDISLPDSRP